MLRAVGRAREPAAIIPLPPDEAGAGAIGTHAVVGARIRAWHVKHLLHGHLTAVCPCSTRITHARAIDTHATLCAVVEARHSRQSPRAICKHHRQLTHLARVCRVTHAACLGLRIPIAAFCDELHVGNTRSVSCAAGKGGH